MATLIHNFLLFFVIAVFVRSILTWFPIGRGNPIQLLVYRITEPVLGPVRNYLPRYGSMDLSSMAVILVILWVLMPAVNKYLG